MIVLFYGVKSILLTFEKRSDHLLIQMKHLSPFLFYPNQFLHRNQYHYSKNHHLPITKINLKISMPVTFYPKYFLQIFLSIIFHSIRCDQIFITFQHNTENRTNYSKFRSKYFDRFQYYKKHI